MANESIQYLIFDVESVADGDLISRVRYPEENLPGDEAISRYRAELLDKYNSDFIPYTFQIPHLKRAAALRFKYSLCFSSSKIDCGSLLIAKKRYSSRP